MGRVLVVEGVEKAERNVLPALNNLLENREMQLEDGRFLMHPKRYDALLKVNNFLKSTHTYIHCQIPKSIIDAKCIDYALI